MTTIHNKPSLLSKVSRGVIAGCVLVAIVELLQGSDFSKAFKWFVEATVVALAYLASGWLYSSKSEIRKER